MAFVLPFWTQPALDFYGLHWPDIDEDKVAELGDHIKKLCDSLGTFADGTSDATGMLAGNGESEAFTAIDEVVVEIETTWIKPLKEEVGPAADQATQLAANGITGYKGAILTALLVNAGSDIALIASGVGIPAAIAKKVITRELLQLAMEEVRRQFIAQVINAWNEQVDDLLLKPIEDLAEAIGKEIIGAVSGIVALAINPSTVGGDAVQLVVDIVDVEEAAKKIRDGYDGVDTALTSLFSWTSGSGFSAEGTPSPDPTFRLEMKAAIDWAIEAFTNKLRETLADMVNGVIDSIVESFKKYVEADQELCTQADSLKDEFQVPPPNVPFVIDRSTRPAPVYWAPADSPVVTGVAGSDAKATLTTWAQAGEPTQTGVAASDASTQLRLILDLEDVEPVVTGAGQSQARFNIQEIVLPEITDPVVTGVAKSEASKNLKQF